MNSYKFDGWLWEKVHRQGIVFGRGYGHPANHSNTTYGPFYDAIKKGDP